MLANLLTIAVLAFVFTRLTGAVRYASRPNVRAHIVEKDHNPKWCPATIAEVDAAWVSAVLAGAA